MQIRIILLKICVIMEIYSSFLSLHFLDKPSVRYYLKSTKRVFIQILSFWVFIKKLASEF